MDLDSLPPKEDDERMETDKKEVSEDKKKKKPKKDGEPQFEILSNLTRVVPEQLKYISFPAGSRYVPVKRVYHHFLLYLN